MKKFRMPIPAMVIAFLTLALVLPLSSCGDTPIEVENPIHGAVFELDLEEYTSDKKDVDRDEETQKICESALEHYDGSTKITTLIISGTNAERALHHLTPLKDTVEEIDLRNTHVGLYYADEHKAIADYPNLKTLTLDEASRVQVSALPVLPSVTDLSLNVKDIDTGTTLASSATRSETLEKMTTAFSENFPHLRSLTVEKPVDEVDMIACLENLPTVESFTYEPDPEKNCVEQAAHLGEIQHLKTINGIPIQDWSLKAYVEQSDLEEGTKETLLNQVRGGELLEVLSDENARTISDATPVAAGKICIVFERDGLPPLASRGFYIPNDNEIDELSALVPDSRFVDDWRDCDTLIYITESKKVEGYWHYKGQSPQTGTPSYITTRYVKFYDMNNNIAYYDVAFEHMQANNIALYTLINDYTPKEESHE